MSEENDKLPVVHEPEVDLEAQDDYELSRDTYRDLVVKGNEGIDMMMDLAREQEHPRAFEVLATMIKSTADVTDKLMDLQKKRAEITKSIDTGQTASGDTASDGKATLKLTTADLQTLVAKHMEDEREKIVVINNDESD